MIICKFCIIFSSNISYNNLLCQLLLQIKEKAGEEVSNISSLLSEEDRGKYILTSVLGMAHNDLSENDRIVAVQV